MKLAEKWNNHSSQKKNIIYWAGVILLINLIIALPQIYQFLQTGQYRNYMVLGSPVAPCTLSQFIKYGHGWMSFTNIFLLIPAASIMVFASKILDIVFEKNKK